MKKTSQARAWRFAVFFSLLLFVTFSVTAVILLRELRTREVQTVTNTEEVYVYLPQEENESELPLPETPETSGYLVKEYRGQIGIFSSDGTLLEILDTYIKTLPEADRALLGEGISVKTKAEMYAIIEDYSH